MYNMEINILGFKIRPVIVILCILVGMSIGSFVLCSCSKISLQEVKEGFESFTSGTNVFEEATPLIPSHSSPSPPDGPLSFYANNKFTPECCSSSSASSSNGCPCVTEEQVKFLASRGGNGNKTSCCTN